MPTNASGASVLGLSAANLTFDDEFNSFTSSPDGSAGWQTQLPYSSGAARNGGNGVLSYASDSSVGANPFSVANGVLSITAAKSTTPLPDGLTYTSGVAQSIKLAYQQYGYFEAGINVSSESGLWPSFYLLPVGNAYGAELDIAEILTYNTKQIYDTVHNILPSGQRVAQDDKILLTQDLAVGFHTIGADWEPDKITWYVDGVVTDVQTTPFGFDTPMYNVLGMGVGGWAGNPPANFVPADMKIDYVRSYATANTVNVGGSGVIANASIAGTVQFAAGSSGTGAPSAGVAVSLIDATGQVIRTEITDANGYFIFTTLAAGSYRVLYTPPSGSAPATGSLPDATTGLSPVTTLAAGAAVLLAPELFRPATMGSVAGSVTLTQPGGSPYGQGGVTVTLMTSGGAVVGTTVTDKQGNFVFSNLAAGSYQVVYTPLSHDVFQGGPGGSGGTTATFALAAGQAMTLAAESMIPAPGELNGTILYSGSHSEGWIGTGESGVTVSLLDSAGRTVATTTTASDGTYSFFSVATGNYKVLVTPPSGQGVATGFNADPATGKTGNITVVPARGTIVPSITLINTPAPSISGSVLFSAPGLSGGNSGVAVTLIGRSGANVLATTTTDASGKFSFINVEPGAYFLRYAAPANETLQAGGPTDATGLMSLTLGFGQALTVSTVTMTGSPGSLTGKLLYAPDSKTGVADPGITVQLRDRAGNVAASTTTDGGGNYAFSNIIPGPYSVFFVMPAGQKPLVGGPAYNGGGTALFTITPGQAVVEPTQTLIPIPGKVSGSVVFGGAGQGGVTVALLDNTGATVATTTTASGTGAFSFAGVAPASYRIQYTAPAGESPISGGFADATGLTGAFTINANATTFLQPETLVPAAVPQFGTITGGVLYAGAVQANVTVSLLDVSTNVLATTTTDGMGSFTFANLAAGSYRLAYTPPAGEALQLGDPADIATGITPVVAVAAGQTLTVQTEDLVAPVNLTFSGTRPVLTQGDGTFVVTGTPMSGKLTLGNGPQTVSLNGYNNAVTTGNGNETVTLTGQLAVIRVGNGDQTLTVNGSFGSVTLGDTPIGQVSTVAVNGSGEAVKAGNGAVNVTGANGSNTVTLGDGAHTVSITGSGNVVTLGTGDATLSVGSDKEVVRSVGGNVTVTMAGAHNLVDLGPGTNVINAGSARLDTFALNGAGQGLTTINGFSATAGNLLDLTRTLAGLNVASDLSNIGSYVTATTSGGGTTLFVDPTGGAGTPAAFVVLAGVSTSVSALLANHDFKVG